MLWTACYKQSGVVQARGKVSPLGAHGACVMAWPCCAPLEGCLHDVEVEFAGARCQCACAHVCLRTCAYVRVRAHTQICLGA